MPEPLILKVQADTQGVPEGFNRITKSAEGLDVSSRKASSALKGFVQDLSSAKDGTDVASAALGAFSKVLGTSLIATGVVVGAKAIIDSFQQVGTTVDEAKERIAKASAEIKKSGVDIGFAQAASEAKRLSDEAEKARESIAKFDKSILMGLVATITGAREELSSLAAEAEALAQKRLFEGALTERIGAELKAGITGAALEIAQIMERVRKELAPVNVLMEDGAKAAAEILKKAEVEIQAIREKALAEEEKRQAAIELKGIEADIKGAEEAVAIARRHDEEAAQKQQENLDKLMQKKQEAEEKLRKEQERLLDKEIELRQKQLDLEQQIIDARKRLVDAEAKLAEQYLKAPGSGRGPGQLPTSSEIGAIAGASRTYLDEQRAMAEADFEAFQEVMKSRGKPSDRVAYQRYLKERMKEQARQRARQPQADLISAQKDVAATEETLLKVKKSLDDTLIELKNYAHAGIGT